MLFKSLLIHFERRFNHSPYLGVILFIFNFLIALPLLLKPMNTETDAYGRAHVYPLLESGIFTITGSVWLPLHQTFVNLTAFLPFDITFSPRLVTLVLSCFLPVWIFSFTKTLTKHVGWSFITALLLIIFPLFREIETTTLSEPFFLFLFIAAIFSLLNQKWLRFGLLLLLSQMARFESWFIMPWVMLLVVQMKKLSWITTGFIIALSLVFPIFYSYVSYQNLETPVAYYHEMAAMAADHPITGVHNFPLAIQSWNKKIFEVFPYSFLGLFLIGLIKFMARKNRNQSQEFVFAILPIFLFVMLVVQVFLQLRDWFPTRYVLIPTIVTFPLIGVGLKTLWQKFPWQKFWQWYVLAGVFFVFELYSAQLNAHNLMQAYTEAEFNDLQTTITQLQNQISLEPTTEIYLYNSPNLPATTHMLDVEFMHYFLLPYETKVAYVDDPTEVTAVATQSSVPKLIIANNLIENTEKTQLVPISVTDHFTVYKPKP